jgi:arylsulfatase A-like enzyme
MKGSLSPAGATRHGRIVGLAAVSLLLLTLLAFLVLRPREIGRDYTCADCNIILVSIDTLRADQLGCYGYERNTSPFIDSIAREEIVFENAVTPKPETNPSMASMLTGLYPYRHGVRFVSQPLESSLDTLLPAVLKQNGFATAAFVSNPVLKASLSGFDRHFDVYDSDVTRPVHTHPSFWERNAEETNERAIRWLGENRNKQLLLWVHYQDPHGPYYPPEEHRSAFDHSERDLIPLPALPAYQRLEHAYVEDGRTDRNDYIDEYDSEILYLDKQLEKLFAKLSELGLLENSLVLILADHGESLGQHHYYFEHGEELYENSARIPLIVRFPEHLAVPRPRRVSSLVSIMDIFPTVLSFLEIDQDASFDLDGVDLLPLLLSGKEMELRSEVFIEKYAENMRGFDKIGVRTKTHKLIAQSRGSECYDLAADPLELNPKGCSDEARASLQKRLAEFAAEAKELGRVGARPKLDAADREMLKALGYIE